MQSFSCRLTAGVASAASLPPPPLIRIEVAELGHGLASAQAAAEQHLFNSSHGTLRHLAGPHARRSHAGPLCQAACCHKVSWAMLSIRKDPSRGRGCKRSGERACNGIEASILMQLWTVLQSTQESPLCTYLEPRQVQLRRYHSRPGNEMGTDPWLLGRRRCFRSFSISLGRVRPGALPVMIALG